MAWPCSPRQVLGSYARPITTVRERFHTGRFHEAASIQRAAFTDMLQELVNHDHQVACVDIYKGWLEIDTFEDYRRAWAKMK